MAIYSVSSWGAEKMRSLIQAGPYFEGGIPPTALLYPESLIVARERSSFAQSNRSCQFIRVLRLRNSRNKYPIPDPHGHDLLSQDAWVEERIWGACPAICVLSRFSRIMYIIDFKAECEDVCSQCVKEENIREVTLRRSKRRNFALGVMMALGSSRGCLRHP